MHKTWEILSFQEKKSFIFFLFLVIISVFFELLSIGAVLPVVTLIFNENSSVNIFLQDFDLLNDLKNTTIINLSLLFLVMIFLLKNIFLSFFYYFEGIFLNRTTQNVSFRIFRNVIFRDMKYHLKTHSSEIVNDLTRETQMFGNFLSSLALILTEIPVVLGISLLVFIFEPKGFLIVFTLSIFMGSIYYLFTKDKIKILGRERKKNEQKKVKYLQEGLGGIKEIKIYGIEKFFMKHFSNTTDNIAKSYYIFNFLNKLPRLYLEFLFVILVAVLIFFFSFKGEDQMQFIPFISVLMLAAFRILPSINRLIAAFQTYNYTKLSMETIHSKTINEFKSNQNADVKDINFKNSISLKNIFFKFDDQDNYIFSNFSFKMQKGDVVSIFGKTGIGKSTLLNIITGLVDPLKGSVDVDEKDIKNLKKAWIKKISYVPQFIFLFDDTIKQNIALGIEDSKIDEERLKKSISISQLDELIQTLPEGLNTKIGERGEKLSGGERQRVGIARAIYHGSDLIILDEATSALDENTEKNFFNSLLGFLDKDKLLIFVSHKKDLLKYSNKTIHLERMNDNN